MGDVKKAFDGAIKAFQNFSNAMTGFTEDGLVEKKGNLPMNSIIENIMIEKLQEAARSGNVDEYRHLRKLQKEQKVSTVFTGEIGTAYLPGPDGKIIEIDSCSIKRIDQNNELQHFSSRNGLRSHNLITSNECTIELSCYGEVRLIDQMNTASIEDFSIIELLDEVEKRTKIEELLSS